MRRNTCKHTLLCAVVLAILVPAVRADDAAMEREAEQAVLSGEENKPVEKIAGQFSDFAGDDTKTLVEALRKGDALSYVIEVEVPVLDDEGKPVMVEVVNDDGSVTEVEKTEWVEQTVTVENTAGPLGYGGVVLALGLAEATLPEEATYQDIVIALLGTETGKGILDLRAGKMGWGQVYAAYDLKVGEVMRDIHSARPEKPTKPEKPEKPTRPEKPEKPTRPEKPAKPEKPGRP